MPIRIKEKQDRKRYFSIVMLLFVSALMWPCAVAQGSGESRIDTIAEYLRASQFELAAALIDEHLAAYPDDGVMQYNAACAQAQIGNIEAAETHLRLAIKHGFLRFSLMQRDVDLKPLRDSRVYQSLMAARLAADGILAGRRNEKWLAQLDDGTYRLTRDVNRKIDVISRYDDQSIEEMMQHVGSIADTLAVFFGGPLRHRITIVLLSAEDARAIFSNDRIRGNYRHAMRELIATNVDRSLQHELAHAFHHNQMDELGQEHPIWVQEGLASLFEAYEVDESGTLVFLPNDRQTMMKYIIERDTFAARWGDLLNCSSRRFKREAHAYYPLARSAFEYVAAFGTIEDWYRDYVGGFDTDSTGRASLELVLRAPLGETELAWRMWVLSRASVPNSSIVAKSGTRTVTFREPARKTNARQTSAHTSVVVTEDGDDSRTIIIERTATMAAAKYAQVRPKVLAGEYAQAMPGLREVLELVPDHGDARYDLALAYIVIGDEDSAWEQHELLKAIDVNLARMVRACLKPRQTSTE